MTKRWSLLAAFLIGAWSLAAGPAAALDEAVAKAHVERTVADVLAVVRSGAGVEAKAEKLRKVMETRAAMPQIARFAAGRNWRGMTEDQQARFAKAFSRTIAVIYARRFQNYAEGRMEVGGAKESGKRGILIASTATLPQGDPIAVDWLVSDRPGRVVIADIVIEGISLLLTQRDEVAGMFEKHGGDAEKLIAELNAT